MDHLCQIENVLVLTFRDIFRADALFKRENIIREPKDAKVCMPFMDMYIYIYMYIYILMEIRLNVERLEVQKVRLGMLFSVSVLHPRNSVAAI